MSSLARSALGGVASNWAGSAVLILAQIASTAVTARLIAPHEFGAYATAQAAAGIAGYFTMNAIGSGLLRRSRLGPSTVGTATVLSLASSAVVAVAVWAGASPWAHSWGVPDAARVVRVIAISLFLTSAATVPAALIRRRLRFGTAVVVETGSQVIALAAGVVLAFHLHSALALALGQVVGASALLVGSVGMTKGELRLGFDRGDAREVFTFAGQVSVLNFSSYLANTAPGWFVARVFGASVLGLYSRASLIVGLPLTYLITSVMKVLYPIYGRVRDDVVRTKILLDEGLTLTTGFVWPLFALVAGASPLVVRILLGERWHSAAPLVALTALIACGDIGCGLLTNAAEAFGWMRLVAMRQIAFFSGVAATLATVHVARLGLNWVLVGVAASQWAAYILTLVPFVRLRFLRARSVAVAQAIHAGVALAAYGVVVACVRAVEGAPLAVQAVTVAVVATAVYATILVSRSWYPAGRVLGRRLAQVAPAAIGWPLLRLKASAR